jgi:hypothetical protein
MKPKNKVFGLIEYYINEFKGEEVRLIYGEGSYVRVHTISESLAKKSLIVEVVIILGNTINENLLDTSLSEILVQDALKYIYPNHPLVGVMARFDV